MHADRDEGISDEDDPAELRILLELNEQEASTLRIKVESLEKDYAESRKQVRELQDKLYEEAKSGKKTGLTGTLADKKIKALTEELEQMKKSILEKEKVIDRLKSEGAGKTSSYGNVDAKRQLDLVEQEASILRSKISSIETENEKLLKENKRLQLQAMRKTPSTEKSNGSIPQAEELNKLKDSLAAAEKERNDLQQKLKIIMQEAESQLPPRSPKRITDLTPKNHLKKWVEELEEEVNEMRVMLLKSNKDDMKNLEEEKQKLEENLKKTQQKLSVAEGDIRKWLLCL